MKEQIVAVWQIRLLVESGNPDKQVPARVSCTHWKFKAKRTAKLLVRMGLTDEDGVNGFSHCCDFQRLDPAQLMKLQRSHDNHTGVSCSIYHLDGQAKDALLLVKDYVDGLLTRMVEGSTSMKNAFDNEWKAAGFPVKERKFFSKEPPAGTEIALV